MEDYLRLGLLALAAVIVFLILFEGWFKRRSLREAKATALSHDADMVLGLNPRTERKSVASSTRVVRTEPVQPAKAESVKDIMDDLIVLMVAAKPDQPFVSYDLLQALTGAGLQFGDMNIFHYHDMQSPQHEVLFSLASSTEPGEFDLDHIGEFSCQGLTLFMRLREVRDPQYAFDLMLRAADVLAETLDGEMRANPRTPWNENVLLQYQQKVLQFQFSNQV